MPILTWLLEISTPYESPGDEQQNFGNASPGAGGNDVYDAIPPDDERPHFGKASPDAGGNNYLDATAADRRRKFLERITSVVAPARNKPSIQADHKTNVNNNQNSANLSDDVDVRPVLDMKDVEETPTLAIRADPPLPRGSSFAGLADSNRYVLKPIGRARYAE